MALVISQVSKATILESLKAQTFSQDSQDIVQAAIDAATQGTGIAVRIPAKSVQGLKLNVTRYSAHRGVTVKSKSVAVDSDTTDVRFWIESLISDQESGKSRRPRHSKVIARYESTGPDAAALVAVARQNGHDDRLISMVIRDGTITGLDPINGPALTSKIKAHMTRMTRKSA